MIRSIKDRVNKLFEERQGSTPESRARLAAILDEPAARLRAREEEIIAHPKNEAEVAYRVALLKVRAIAAVMPPGPSEQRRELMKAIVSMPPLPPELLPVAAMGDEID